MQRLRILSSKGLANKMNIILIRHAQTLKNKEGVCQSHNDSEITAKGLRQLEMTKDFLKNYDVDEVYCSSLQRAIKTAKKIFEGRKIKVTPDDRLKEINWGEYSAMRAMDVLKKWSIYYEEEKLKGIPREEIRPPKGENAFDHLKRIKEFFSDILNKHANDTIAIVGHSGTNKVLIGMLNNKAPEEFYQVKQDNACINLIEVDEDEEIVKQELNIIKHLV